MGGNWLVYYNVYALPLLQANKIPIAQFATHVLGRLQGRVSEILNRPKAFEKLSEEGKEPYRKINKWLQLADRGHKGKDARYE